jgi:hypothetical protein
MKLAGGSPAFAHELSVDAFLQQVSSAAGVVGQYLKIESLPCSWHHQFRHARKEV